jgi:Zn-dependent metalloprotease
MTQLKGRTETSTNLSHKQDFRINARSLSTRIPKKGKWTSSRDVQNQNIIMQKLEAPKQPKIDPTLGKRKTFKRASTGETFKREETIKKEIKVAKVENSAEEQEND